MGLFSSIVYETKTIVWGDKLNSGNTSTLRERLFITVVLLPGGFSRMLFKEA